MRNFYHYRNNGSYTLPSPITVNNVYFSGDNLDTASVTRLSTNSNIAWDQVNIEFGKHLDLGQSDFIRFHGGLNFSRVAGSTGFSGLSSKAASGSLKTIYSNINNTSSYNGLGGRIGLNLNHELINHLNIYADGAFSLLTGAQKYAINGTETINGVVYQMRRKTTSFRAWI